MCVFVCVCRRADAATINRVVRRQSASMDGQRKGVSNDIKNCANAFQIFIDPMTTEATLNGSVCKCVSLSLSLSLSLLLCTCVE